MPGALSVYARPRQLFRRFLRARVYIGSPFKDRAGKRRSPQHHGSVLNWIVEDIRSWSMNSGINDDDSNGINGINGINGSWKGIRLLLVGMIGSSLISRMTLYSIVPPGQEDIGGLIRIQELGNALRIFFRYWTQGQRTGTRMMKKRYWRFLM